MSSVILRRSTRLSWTSVLSWHFKRAPSSRCSTPVAFATRHGTRSRRGLVCNAAVNAQDCTQSAVDDCLERVLDPAAKSPCDFAVVFFEGHDCAGVQEALDSFAARHPNAPPVVGCSLGDGEQQQRQHRLRAKYSPSSSSPHGALFRSPIIVTVLGVGFGGRAEVIPVWADGGSFPSFAGEDSISRIFALPKERQPLFLLLCQHGSPSSDVEDSFGRLGNLLPGGTRLSGLSSGNPSAVVSSFPSADAPVVGFCLLGEISIQEQAELARKTLGAFGLDSIDVAGSVCDELFVPSAPPSSTPSQRLIETPPFSVALTADIVNNPAPDAEPECETDQQQQQQGPSQQLCVFMVEDFVFPGMTRRFRIFEPRYRALVKRCLSQGEALLILPLSRGGNTVGTAAYVSGLHRVEEDGRCEIEVTGISRCHVRTMWMKGESFGLHEAVVEYFRDEDGEAHHDKNFLHGEGTFTHSPRRAANSSTGKPLSGIDGGVGAAAAGNSKRDIEPRGEAEPQEMPELERLRIQVSAVLQKELFRTRKMGRSPLWPGWDGVAVEASASAWDAVSGNGRNDNDNDNDNGNGNGNGRNANDSGRGIGAVASSIDALDPCDLEAEALSFWAAQNVAGDVLTKHRWLSCASTEERLRDIRGVCEMTMARYRDRGGGGGGVDW